MLLSSDKKIGEIHQGFPLGSLVVRPSLQRKSFEVRKQTTGYLGCSWAQTKERFAMTTPIFCSTPCLQLTQTTFSFTMLEATPEEKWCTTAQHYTTNLLWAWYAACTFLKNREDKCHIVPYSAMFNPPTCTEERKRKLKMRIIATISCHGADGMDLCPDPITATPGGSVSDSWGSPISGCPGPAAKPSPGWSSKSWKLRETQVLRG